MDDGLGDLSTNLVLFSGQLKLTTLDYVTPWIHITGPL